MFNSADWVKMESSPHKKKIFHVRAGHYAILGGILDDPVPHFKEGYNFKDTELLPELTDMNEYLICQYTVLDLT